jgi:hypothetical protein
VVLDQLAEAACEDGRSAGEARPLPVLSSLKSPPSVLGLSRWQRQQVDPPYYGPEETVSQMASSSHRGKEKCLRHRSETRQSGASGLCREGERVLAGIAPAAESPTGHCTQRQSDVC